MSNCWMCSFVFGMILCDWGLMVQHLTRALGLWWCSQQHCQRYPSCFHAIPFNFASLAKRRYWRYLIRTGCHYRTDQMLKGRMPLTYIHCLMSCCEHYVWILKLLLSELTILSSGSALAKGYVDPSREVTNTHPDYVDIIAPKKGMPRALSSFTIVTYSALVYSCMSLLCTCLFVFLLFHSCDQSWLWYGFVGMLSIG